MKRLYDWHDVARRTVIVYDYALRSSDQNLLERLSRYTIDMLMDTCPLDLEFICLNGNSKEYLSFR